MQSCFKRSRRTSGFVIGSPESLAANHAKLSESGRLGFSNAAKYRKAKKFSRVRANDVESPANDEISNVEEDNDTKKLTFEDNSEYEKIGKWSKLK